MSITISIIIPVYNEKESLEELYGEIRAATGSFSKREVLFIDDGSTDGTTELLQTMAEEYVDVTLIQFYRNYGKAAALAEGFNYATGDYIVTMDADLQDDPSEINTKLEFESSNTNINFESEQDRVGSLARKIIFSHGISSDNFEVIITQ